MRKDLGSLCLDFLFYLSITQNITSSLFRFQLKQRLFILK